MTTLSPKDRALLDAARKGWGPSASTTRAVRAGIPARLRAEPMFGIDAPGPENVTASATRLTAAKAFLRSPVGVAAGLTVVGLFAVFVTRSAVVERPEPPPLVVSTAGGSPLAPTPAPAPATENASPTIGTVTIDSLPDAVPEAPPKRPVAPAVGASPAAPERGGPEHATDNIAEEVALVGAAQRSLRDGSPNEALTVLSAHAARFPSGALREERMALQVLALCALGDLPRARHIRMELEQLAPSSSHLQRLSCASP